MKRKLQDLLAFFATATAFYGIAGLCQGWTTADASEYEGWKRTALPVVVIPVNDGHYHTTGQSGDLKVEFNPSAMLSKGKRSVLEFEGKINHHKGGRVVHTLELLHGEEILDAMTSSVHRVLASAERAGDETVARPEVSAKYTSPENLTDGDYCLRLTVVAKGDDGFESSKASTQCFEVKAGQVLLLDREQWLLRNTVLHQAGGTLEWTKGGTR
jgi:hypothetical protein